MYNIAYMYTVLDLMGIFHIVNFQLKILILSRDIVNERNVHCLTASLNDCLTALFPFLDSSLQLMLSEYSIFESGTGYFIFYRKVVERNS